jgi:cytochrome c oxidase cbb3-type subunit 3
MPTKIEKDEATGQFSTGHEWDGITELDTPLPLWWLYTFYACIAFALVWVVLYPSLPGWKGITGWVAREAVVTTVATEEARRGPMMARLRAATPATIAADPELRAFALAGGRAAFAANCAGCHGAGGQGAPGGYPSLADDEWIHGGTLAAIGTTITHGVRNPEDPDARGVAMPAFSGAGLTGPQISDLAEHVLAISGRPEDAAAAARGAALFAENCVACHGERGEGNRTMGAPRLTDQVWLYGNDKVSIMRMIANPRLGVMPAWGLRLDPAVVNMLTVYVHALGGGE